MLLQGEHINMPERIECRAWAHPPFSRSEVLAHLTRLLHRDRRFPRDWQRHREGEPVQEGGTVERQGPDREVYRAVRSHPNQPRVLAESTERVFSSAEDAARYYLKWDRHLPGDPDGWKVIE
jgi:hypothetical protein